MSCNENKTEFYSAPQFRRESSYENHKDYNDVIFVINPPTDDEKLYNLMRNYNDETIAHDSVEKKYTSYHRMFFKESSKTPRTFIEDPGGFSVDILDDHVEDYLATYSMRACPNNQKMEWRFSQKGKTEKYVVRSVRNKCY
ncbi:hypothetical protein [Flavobacterium sp. UBA7663]|uniref:hypothetical protein n=1 Tax=Flavobacterium sp. UBA7663 TaxID=1946557 RepID=UPI0025BA954C|nr:hypothetical protein [Flavobacterium sp. UBA7663]